MHGVGDMPTDVRALAHEIDAECREHGFTGFEFVGQFKTLDGYPSADLIRQRWEQRRKGRVPPARDERTDSDQPEHPRSKLPPAELRRLRGRIDIVRERYSFKFTMQRWALLVWEDDANRWNRRQQDRIVADNAGGKDEDELIEELLIKELATTDECSDASDMEQGRTPGAPPKRLERYATLLLALIFAEYTQQAPKRHCVDGVDDNSPFYKFARASFEAIKIKTPYEILRETCEDWPHLGENDKQQLKRLLWGQLVEGSTPPIMT
jgi:hypothetical protein